MDDNKSFEELYPDASLFANKDYLLYMLKECFNHIQDLKQNSLKISEISSIPPEVSEWLMKRESNEEKIQKILLNLTEEWRAVLPLVPFLISNSLIILDRSKPKEAIFEMVLHMLHSVSVCINPKRMNKYWPTDVQWLPKVTTWLQDYLRNYHSENDYRSVMLLILWLSSAIRTPFDLNRFQIPGSKISFPELIATEIIDGQIEKYSLYSVMHLLSAAYYSRPDCYQRLSLFLDNLSKILSSNTTEISSKSCCLRIMATLLKTVDRSIMANYVDDIFKLITTDAIDSKDDALIKLQMKICGRIALIHLKPSSQFKWKYRCGKRVNQLMTNGGQTSQTESGNLEEQDAQDEDFELPEYFEKLIQLLLTNLVYKNVEVRFSVAKYLAAIGSRLPFEYSDEILENILSLCSPNEDDNCWHGACLAIAEFVRRGYVRIEELARIVRILEHALYFEQVKGSFLCGSNVRDAACYICWSMARAYDGQMISKYVSQLAPPLLNVACFDQELNCRRAASAVIQELAGRTQQFPHWIDVIPRTEFRELNYLDHTYLDLGYHFATSYPDFRPWLLTNLFEQKCSHWLPNIRRLAAKTLGHISKKCPMINEKCFQDFFKEFKNLEKMDLNKKHGRILAISCILAEDDSLNGPDVDYLGSVFREIFLPLSKTLKTMSKSTFGANLIRESLLVFVKKCFPRLMLSNVMKSNLDLEQEIKSFILDSIQTNDCCELIQTETIETLSVFLKLASANKIDDYILKLADLIIPGANDNQQFHVSTLMKFFSEFLDVEAEIKPETIRKLLKILNEFLNKWFDLIQRRPETIADTIRAILVLASSKKCSLLSSNDPDLMENIHKNVLRCLDDHSITNKGDTGLIVRPEAIESIYDYCLMINGDKRKLLEVIQLICSEAAANRKRTFVLAVKQLMRLANDQTLGQLDLVKDCLKNLSNSIKKENEEDLSKMDNHVLYGKCLQLFECTMLTKHIWLGCLTVIGDAALHQDSKMITDYLETSKQRDHILKCFLEVIEANSKCKRLSIPALNAAHLVLTRVTTDQHFQDRVAIFAWSACEKQLNLRKYCLACDIFCALLSFNRIKLVIGYLWVLLGHRLPRVRHYASIQMFTAALSLDIDHDDDNINDNDNDGIDHEDDNLKRSKILSEIGQLLQQTEWNDLNESKRVRDHIKQMFIMLA